MQKQNILFSSLLLLILIWTSPAMAGNGYIGYTTGPAEVSDNVVFQDPYGPYLFGGYQTEYPLAFEYGIVAVGEKLGANELVFGGSNFTVLGSLPLGPVSIFARAGMVRWIIVVNDEEIDDGTTPTYGGGLDFHLGEHWGLRLEWQRYTKVGTTTETDIDHSRLGVKYSF